LKEDGDLSVLSAWRIITKILVSFVEFGFSAPTLARALGTISAVYVPCRGTEEVPSEQEQELLPFF